jgi:peptidoglycan hydrolase-like protein with peptidoglycan-binding domain
VRSFQANNGLPVTGIVWPTTWAKLLPVTVEEGMVGNKVRAVQHLLRYQQGFDEIPVDGTFDSFVKLRVMSVQTRYGLPATGRVDSWTWKALLSD